jgi:hypothetical protein
VVLEDGADKWAFDVVTQHRLQSFRAIAPLRPRVPPPTDTSAEAAAGAGIAGDNGGLELSPGWVVCIGLMVLSIGIIVPFGPKVEIKPEKATCNNVNSALILGGSELAVPWIGDAVHRPASRPREHGR